MRIAVTGTPGTGKSSVAEKLAERLGYELVRINEILLRDYKVEKDEERDTWVVDVERAVKEVRLPENCVVEGHLSHLFPVDVVIVLRTRPKELKKRLEGRGWSSEKIRENLEAEALNVIAEEARELCDEVYEVDTTEKSVDEVVEEIIKVLKGGGEKHTYDFLEDITEV